MVATYLVDQRAGGPSNKRTLGELGAGRGLPGQAEFYLSEKGETDGRDLLVQKEHIKGLQIQEERKGWELEVEATITGQWNLQGFP